MDSFKNGAHGITGKAVLAAYFAIGSSSRFLTFASLYQDIIFLHEIIPESDPARIAVLLSSTLLPICLHFLGSIVLQGYFFPDAAISQRLLRALWSFICPPLFLDWEVMYRASRFRMPIGKCWKRSVAFFVCHNALILVETLLFSIPVFLFKNDIGENPTKWSAYFVWIVGLQIDLLVANVLVIPLILGGLAYFYFAVKGHPWARILKSAQNRQEAGREKFASEGCLAWEGHERITPLSRSKSY